MFGHSSRIESEEVDPLAIDPPQETEGIIYSNAFAFKSPVPISKILRLDAATGIFNNVEQSEHQLQSVNDDSSLASFNYRANQSSNIEQIYIKEESFYNNSQWSEVLPQHQSHSQSINPYYNTASNNEAEEISNIDPNRSGLDQEENEINYQYLDISSSGFGEEPDLSLFESDASYEDYILDSELSKVESVNSETENEVIEIYPIPDDGPQKKLKTPSGVVVVDSSVIENQQLTKLKPVVIVQKFNFKTLSRNRQLNLRQMNFQLKIQDEELNLRNRTVNRDFIQSFSTSNELVKYFEKKVKVGRPKIGGSNIRSNMLHICFACQKPCTSEKNLVLHFNYRHMRFDKCSCPECSFLSDEKQGLIEHLINVHNRTWDNFKCALCPYRCCDLSNLRSHLVKKHQLHVSPHYVPSKFLLKKKIKIKRCNRTCSSILKSIKSCLKQGNRELDYSPPQETGGGRYPSRKPPSQPKRLSYLDPNYEPPNKNHFKEDKKTTGTTLSFSANCPWI